MWRAISARGQQEAPQFGARIASQVLTEESRFPRQATAICIAAAADNAKDAHMRRAKVAASSTTHVAYTKRLHNFAIYNNLSDTRASTFIIFPISQFFIFYILEFLCRGLLSS